MKSKFIDEARRSESEHPYEVSVGIATTIAGIWRRRLNPSSPRPRPEEWASLTNFFVSSQ